MRAGVNNFSRGTVREIDVRALVAEAELQHRHAGNLQPFAQGMHFGSDVTEIFREKWQPAQGLAKFLKQVIARTINPAAIYRGRLGRRNLPELVEATEMIEPHVVAISRGPAQALDPPGIALGFHRVPAIKRVAPALPGLAEEVGRHAGHSL